MLVNDVVDTGGISFAYRVTEDVGVAMSTPSGPMWPPTRFRNR